MAMLFKKSKFTLKLNEDGEMKQYGEIIGFFAFRNNLFYRSKGVAGRSLSHNNMSFTEFLHVTYPKEFRTATAREISKVLVQPLKVEK